ncbi:hypothetical protein FJT64_027216 [Amphibalanus amphitrite]|uniref:Uncharacterized protein n=1 Tax=Amphibalanus amphitrite TaxID=1232801 RepID=A0A6A4W2X5_AMPAM|nr:hypothetical protein FJT64_027216 [Amphibalanus amphitrite]
MPRERRVKFSRVSSTEDDDDRGIEFTTPRRPHTDDLGFVSVLPPPPWRREVSSTLRRESGVGMGLVYRGRPPIAMDDDKGLIGGGPKRSSLRSSLRGSRKKSKSGGSESVGAISYACYPSVYFFGVT